jgi:MEMO1 family protein
MGSASAKSNLYIREATHSGSWYDSDAKSLDETLESYLQNVVGTTSSTGSTERLRGLIVPHAGYSYSGPTAAYAYQVLKEELQKAELSPIRRILVLHPSHHVYLEGCAVSGASHLATPFGDLAVDDDLRREILSLSSASFTVMTKREDDEEHSGEMQYPYICKILAETNRTDIRVLPVMCGSLSTKKEKSYGNALEAIIARPDVCTVVSSDFCHWGSRFSFSPISRSIPLHEYIERMDRTGMDLIALKEPGAFTTYLKETRNTICGRHAIAVWLNALAATPVQAPSPIRVTFIHYAQSCAVKSMHDSSVSYAAAKATV